MINDIKGFHIEPTNICTLKCPRCARTKFIEQFPKKWINHQLDLDKLKQFLDIDLTDKKILLCGNYGDPIYYDKLFELISWIQIKGGNIHIITNGSYKKEEWWKELAKILREIDSITFSIDGTPDNFTQYRINAEWKSILLGIKEMTKGSAKTIWKYIPFSYNIDGIEFSRNLSKELGITEFIVDPSDRWDSDSDWLKPTELVNDRYKSIVKWRNKESLEINPKCINNKTYHYISANGFYMPCCFVGDHRFYYKSEFYKKRYNYDISNTTISQILKTDEFYSSIEKNKYDYCTFNCPKI